MNKATVEKRYPKLKSARFTRISTAINRYIKGKSAIHLARVYGERKRNFVG
jgi:hypothetical protein